MTTKNSFSFPITIVAVQLIQPENRVHNYIIYFNRENFFISNYSMFHYGMVNYCNGATFYANKVVLLMISMKKWSSHAITQRPFTETHQFETNGSVSQFYNSSVTTGCSCVFVRFYYSKYYQKLAPKYFKVVVIIILNTNTSDR